MEKKAPGNIADLTNEYTQTKKLQAHRLRKQKKQMKRRVAFILTIGFFVIAGLIANIWTSAQTISDMEEETVSAESELKKVEIQNNYLTNQIKQLEDEDYVAKLARSQYYLSKDNEIIFSLPEDNAAKIMEETREKETTGSEDEQAAENDED